MNTKQEEFIESFKALLIRYNLEIYEKLTEFGDTEYCFIKESEKININIREIYAKLNT